MKTVLDCGPWMIQNVPLVLNNWEPGIWLDKTEPSSIPIWVCVYNIAMELCNGNGIGKIMSGVGKPIVMDRMTKERCLKKAGKLDCARVLVEVSTSEVFLKLSILLWVIDQLRWDNWKSNISGNPPYVPIVKLLVTPLLYAK